MRGMNQDQQRIFLKAVSEGATLSHAAKLAHVPSSLVRHLEARDADFAEGLRLAMEDAIDVIEASARHRAIGYDEPVIYQGQLTPIWETDENGRAVQARNPDGSLKFLTVRKYSDAMTALLLKGYRKRLFADRVEHTGADGGPIAMDAPARAARIASLIAAAQARRDAGGDLA